MLLPYGSDGSLINATTTEPKRPSLGYRSESPRDVCTPDDGAAPPTQDDARKPFFVMDWLEKLKPTDLAIARNVLQTPQTSRNRKTLGEGSASTPAAAGESERRGSSASPSVSLPKKPVSPFLRRSVTIGNGWNAKGLKKAKSNKWEEALLCWENALEIRTQVLGDQHLDVANTYNNMGIAHGKLNNISQAMSFLHRALDIRVAHYGQDHEEVAATLHNIGNVHQQVGDLESAIQCFCQAKNIQVSLLGNEHPQIARACIAMGHVYYQARDFEDARLAYMDALTIFEKSGLSPTSLEVQSLEKDIDDLDRQIRGK
jgi:predicted HD phosphohydrolase